MRAAPFAGLLLALTACGSAVGITLEVPAGTKSALVVGDLDGDPAVFVHAFDFEAGPVPFEFDGRDDDRLVALYYRSSLAELGVDPGRQPDRVERRPAPVPDEAAMTTVASRTWSPANAIEAARGAWVPRYDSAACSQRGGCWVVDHCVFACDVSVPEPPMPPRLPTHGAFVETSTINACGRVLQAPVAAFEDCPVGRRTWDGGCVDYAPCPDGPYAEGTFDYYADDDATLEAALAAARDGESIALAKGTYRGFTAPRRVSIVGACTAATTVTATLGAIRAIDMEAGGGLSSMSVLTSRLTGAAIRATGPFEGADLIVAGDVAGVRLNGSGPATIRDSRIVSAGAAVITETSSATLQDVTVRALDLGVRCTAGALRTERTLVVSGREGIRVLEECRAEFEGLHTATASVGLWVLGEARVDDLRAEIGQGFFFARGSRGTVRGVTFTGINLGDAAGLAVAFEDIVGHVTGRGLTMFRNGVGSVERLYVDGTGVFALDLNEGRWSASDVCVRGIQGTPVLRVRGFVSQLARVAIFDTKGNISIEVNNEAEVDLITDLRIDGVAQGGLLLGPRNGVLVKRVHITRPTGGEVPTEEFGLWPTLIDVDLGSAFGLLPPVLEDVRLGSGEADSIYFGVHARVTADPPVIRRFAMDLPFRTAVRIGVGARAIRLEDGVIEGSDIAVSCTVPDRETVLDRVRLGIGVLFDDRACVPIGP